MRGLPSARWNSGAPGCFASGEPLRYVASARTAMGRVMLTERPARKASVFDCLSFSSKNWLVPLEFRVGPVRSDRRRSADGFARLWVNSPMRSKPATATVHAAQSSRPSCESGMSSRMESNTSVVIGMRLRRGASPTERRIPRSSRLRVSSSGQ